MRFGFDLDGCLADFNTSFIKRVIQVTEKDLFPPRPFDIPCWDSPQHYGYTTAEVSKVWDSICADTEIWLSLPEYPETATAMREIERLTYKGHDVYFITARPGRTAKRQTERWLSMWIGFPTVLISSDKGGCAQALKLDRYIDDKWENAVDVAMTDTKVFLMNRPWNQNHPSFAAEYSITRVNSVLDMITV